MLAQVDIPNAARSALDTLKQQRLQRQAFTAAAPKPSTLSMLPPVEDTLPPSLAAADNDANPAPLENIVPTFGDQLDGDSTRDLVMGSPPVTAAVLMSSADDQNETGRDARRSKVTAEGTLAMPVDQPQGSSKGAPITDTLTDSQEPHDSLVKSAPLADSLYTQRPAAGKIDQDEDEDETLIRQAVEFQVHEDVANSPAFDQEDDDALLQGLLAEEEKQPA